MSGDGDKEEREEQRVESSGTAGCVRERVYVRACVCVYVSVCVCDSLDALNGGPGLPAAVQSLVHVQRCQTQGCVTLHLHGKALLKNVTHTLHKHTHTHRHT